MSGDLDFEPIYCALREQLKIHDTMLMASNKAKLTKQQLCDTLVEEGLMAVYNLGMKHMYDYLNTETREEE